MKTNFTLRTGLLLAFVLALTNITAQVTGDFRTTSAIGVNGLANAAGWQRYNGTDWLQATYSPVGNFGSQAVKGFGTAAAGTNTITLTAENPLIRVNQYVTATGVPVGTVVTAISGTTLTLSQNTTAAITTTPPITLNFLEEFSSSITGATTGNTNVNLTAANPAVVVGMGVTHGSLPVGAIVTAVNGATLTLSAAPTATIASGQNFKFFTKETTATTTAGSTTITLKAPNSLVAVGMDVYSVTNGLIQNSATVTSINGAVVTISIPVATAYAGLPVQFAFFGTIPNLYINHSTNTVNNSKSYHIGNVFVNDANSTNVGAGELPTNATLGIGGTSTSATIFMCETLTVAASAKVNIATTTSNLTNNFFITGGIGGNAINNNGVINLLASPGTTTTKTNIFFSGSGNTALSGTGTCTFGLFSLNRNTLNLTLAANTSIVGGTFVTGSSLVVNSGTTFTNSAGTAITNNGSITVDGTINNAGTLTNASVITNNGVINNTGTLTNNLTITNSGIINNTGSLTSTPANSNIINKSTATATGSLLSNSFIINVTQQRYLSSNQRGWRLLSNPIATKTFSAFANQSTINIGAGFVGAYNSADDTWSSADGTASMEFQKAYKVFITGPRGESPTYATGPSNVTLINKGTADFGVPAAITTVAGQYYLVGNPYTAPVSVAGIFAASTGLSTTVSYYNPTNASIDVKVKAGGYDSISVSGAPGSATDVVIPAMGAIFVKADSDGTINIPKAAIFTGTPGQNGTYNHKTAQPKVASTNVLKVQASDGNQTIN